MFYTYYVKAENKYYFGSRTNKKCLKRAAKDDFMIHYFTSTQDKRLQEIIRNKEYEKAEIIKEYTDSQECRKDEERLIKLFWAFYGTENSWNHHADGKWSTAGIPNPKQSIRMKNNTYFKGKKMTKESREKISKARKGKPSPNKGKIGIYNHTKETKEKLSKLNQGENNAFFNKKHSEHIKKVIGEKNSKALKEYYKTHEIWNKGKKMSAEAVKHNSEAQKIAQNKPETLAKHRKPKPKFYWKTPNGEIMIKDRLNAIVHHPDWILIGPVED